MHRSLASSLAAVALTSALALADPGIDVTYYDGAMRVQLRGSYPGTYYTVWRSGEYAGEYNSMMASQVLCTADCFVRDLDAVPGRTYYYRFDLILPDGQFVTYGPYAVTVPDTPFAARLWPNPGQGVTRVMLSLPGSRRDAPLATDARILDLQGRTVRVILHGPVARGNTTIVWDGRGDGGRELGAGVYFLRFTSALGRSSTRVIRIR